MTSVDTVTIRAYTDGDREQVVRLWETCGLTVPWNKPGNDIDRKLTVQKELFLVAEDAEGIIGSAMAGYDGHRGSVFYLGVLPSHQKAGVGRMLMERIERDLTEMGCPKINLMIRSTNLGVQAFYEAIGYEKADVVVYGKRLIPDS